MRPQTDKSIARRRGPRGFSLAELMIALGVLAMGLLVIGWLAGGVLRLGEFLPGELITWGMRLMQGDTSASWIAFGVSLGLIVVPLALAGVVFSNQEL